MVEQVNGKEVAQRMPSGPARVMKSLLGIDPEQIMEQFNASSKMLMDFCKHFDNRMVLLHQELAQLKKANAELHAKIEASLGELENGNDRSRDDKAGATGTE